MKRYSTSIDDNISSNCSNIGNSSDNDRDSNSNINCIIIVLSITTINDILNFTLNTVIVCEIGPSGY